MTRSERGMALAATLLALIVIGALVAGAFASAQLEQRIGRNTLYALQAASAAEAGAVEVLAAWAGLGLDALAAGDSAVLPAVALPSRAGYTPTVRRLNGELFLIRVVGRRGDAGGGLLAERTVKVLARVADSLAPGSPPVVRLAHRSWIPEF